jgi:hypothetical protein
MRALRLVNRKTIRRSERTQAACPLKRRGETVTQCIARDALREKATRLCSAMHELSSRIVARHVKNLRAPE